jgi:hypothetical protein
MSPAPDHRSTTLIQGLRLGTWGHRNGGRPPVRRREPRAQDGLKGVESDELDPGSQGRDDGNTCEDVRGRDGDVEL